MRRVSPSVIAREELGRLLSGGADREANIVSAFVEAVTRMVVQEIIEGEQGDYLGGRGRYQRRGDGQVGWRNGYSAVGCAPRRVRSTSRCRRSAGPTRRSGRRC